MPAMRNKVRELRKEINDQADLIKTLKRTINMRDRQIEDMQDRTLRQLETIVGHSSAIRNAFEKEFIWFELGDRTDKKIITLQRALDAIEILGRTNKTYNEDEA